MRKISAPLVLAVALLGCGGGGGNPYHFDFTLYLGSAAGDLNDAIGDLNNDGKPDLAVVNEGSISVLLQSATPGVFLPRNTLKAHTPWRAAIADLNQDGLNDLAIAEYNGARLYFQNPSVPGTFEPSLRVRP